VKRRNDLSTGGTGKGGRASAKKRRSEGRLRVWAQEKKVQTPAMKKERLANHASRASAGVVTALNESDQCPVNRDGGTQGSDPRKKT